MAVDPEHKPALMPPASGLNSLPNTPMQARELDLYQCPLHGVQLIEASAGTGKTFNICGLYLRLLLECNHSVQDILVVTFTNAATAELRERIRQKIADAVAYLEGNARLANDPLISGLMASLQAKGFAADRLLVHCRLALASFDEASIFTIHGFCQRALSDAPFTAHMPLSQELLQDDSAMVAEVVGDFWRQRLGASDLSPALAAYLSGQKDSPERWAQLLRRHLAKPLSHTLWPADLELPCSASEAALQTAFDAAKRCWTAQRAVVLDTLKAALSQLSAVSYKPASVEAAAREWDALLRGDDAVSALEFPIDKAPLLGSERLQKACKKQSVPPEHLFFGHAQHFLDTLEALSRDLVRARLRLLKALLLDGAHLLQERKRTQRVVAFNDMLYNVYAQLHSDNAASGAALASALRKRFPVAMVDEFQDTDPLQFAVFHTIYGRQAGPLFMVGDPKQAIYSFRNADLHTYLKARSEAAAQYSLGHNQRSIGPLIDALNALFQCNHRVFMLDGLQYHPVKVGLKARKVLQDLRQPRGGCARAPLTLWELPLPEPDAPNALKRDMQQATARACAAEIADLLHSARQGQTLLDGHPLQAGDIAVLVRTHNEGSLIRAALTALRIGSVELSQSGIYQSPDAMALMQILAAALEPSRTQRIYAALATDCMAYNAAEIDALRDKPTELLLWVERFTQWHAVWLHKGVGVMLRHWLTSERIAEKMLVRADGERRLTNLLHLFECLHQAAAVHPAPDALLHWLHIQIQNGSGDDASQLRLESDQNLVQIVTIHRSKGLEYPIVFCPYLWNGRLPSQADGLDGVHYYDSNLGSVHDFRSENDPGFDPKLVKASHREDQSAEFLRLVYVALTRAVQRCYVVVGCYQTRIKDALKTSESQRALLNWMVAGNGLSPDQWFANPPTPEDIHMAWQRLASQPDSHIALSDLPLENESVAPLSGTVATDFAALPPPQHLPPGWWTGSYSGLIHGIRHEQGAIDHDARIAGDAVESPMPNMVPADNDILLFPRGPEAGECLHSVFENADFTDEATWPTAIAVGLRHLQAFQGARRTDAAKHTNGTGSMGDPYLKPKPNPIPDTQHAMLTQMLTDVLNTPLLQSTVAAAFCSPLTLRSVSNQRRLTEMEFLMPSAALDARTLRNTLQTLGYPAPALEFGQLRGFLKGFIDLVFEHDGRYFVLDWKSNHLGTLPQSYTRPALENAMQAHAYHLQYLLYCVALHRYLALRIKNYTFESHFGGVLYLFIRGVRPGWKDAHGNPTGVYFDRPSAQAIAQLSELLMPQGGI